MSPILAKYDHDEDSRRAMREFEQGASHARQGRTDLLGLSPSYDEGFAAGARERDDK